MVAILKKWVRLIELPLELRNLKEKGYRKGRWAWEPGTDRIEIRTWRNKKEGRKSHL